MRYKAELNESIDNISRSFVCDQLRKLRDGVRIVFAEGGATPQSSLSLLTFRARAARYKKSQTRPASGSTFNSTGAASGSVQQ